MRWIQTEIEIGETLNAAYTCVGVDSGRLPTDLSKLVFDEMGIDSIEFGRLILLLITLSGEASATYTVLRPDPIHYYYRTLGRYPAFKIESGDSPESYSNALHEKLKEGSIDDVGTFWSEFVIAPPSRTWFVHAVRTSRDDGGHLWLPKEWIKQALDCYEWLDSSSDVGGKNAE